MSATDPTPTDTQSRSGSGRTALIVTGAVLVILALLPLGAGGALLGLHTSERDADGYYASGASRITTDTRAFVTEGLDVGSDGPDWLLEQGRLGTLRVTASGTPEHPVFVGIARETQVDGYLRGVDRAEIVDVDLDPVQVTTDRHAGTAVPAPPAGQSFWAESATGAGERTIEWPVEEGDWRVVVMNADGAPGVSTDVSIGAKLGFLVWLAAALLGVGGVLLAGGLVALVLGLRRPPSGTAPSPLATPRLAAEV